MIVCNCLMYVIFNLHFLCSKICIVHAFENLHAEFFCDQFASNIFKRRNYCTTRHCIMKRVTPIISRNRHRETRVTIVGHCRLIILPVPMSMRKCRFSHTQFSFSEQITSAICTFTKKFALRPLICAEQY